MAQKGMGSFDSQNDPLRESSRFAQDDKAEDLGRRQHSLLDFASKSHRKR
jgi:hypothetical protein